MSRKPKGPFVHERAIVEKRAIVGPGTRVWAFAHVLARARIGRDCNICDHVFIEGDVVVGDRVTVKPGVQLWDGLRVEDDVFIGPNATFANDRFPRSKQYQETIPRTYLRAGASIGANATVLSGVTVGTNSMIGAGAVVTTDVPPNSIVAGNPARISGYVAVRKKGALLARKPLAGSSRVRGVRFIKLSGGVDLRGRLVAASVGGEIPFEPRRLMVVADVPSKEVRGERAYRRLEQFIICLRGSCSLLLDDGREREEALLDSPETGVFVPAGVWTSFFRHSSDAMVLVAASRGYEPDDYIRDYGAFREAALVKRKRTSR